MRYTQNQPQTQRERKNNPFYISFFSLSAEEEERYFIVVCESLPRRKKHCFLSVRWGDIFQCKKKGKKISFFILRGKKSNFLVKFFFNLWLSFFSPSFISDMIVNESLRHLKLQLFLLGNFWPQAIKDGRRRDLLLRTDRQTDRRPTTRSSGRNEFANFRVFLIAFRVEGGKNWRRLFSLSSSVFSTEGKRRQTKCHKILEIACETKLFKSSV